MRLFLWLAWGEWRAQPVRNALSVAAIAIGVALGFAVHLVNEVALDRFNNSLNRARGAADLQIVANGAAGFDEALYGRLLADDGPLAGMRDAVVAASPVVEREVTVRGFDDIVLRVMGVDAMRAAVVTPTLVGSPVRSINQRDDDDDTPLRTIDYLDADAIYVPQGLLDRMNKRAGDTLTIDVDGSAVVLRIAGRLFSNEADEGTTVAASKTGTPIRRFRATMDIGGAQWRTARLGRLSRIDLRLAPGADPAKVGAAIAAMLPGSARITTAGDDRARTGDLSRAYRVNLDMLALMALFTGAFLVYSTQSLAVARRRSQLALLRVVGMKRWRVVVQVIAEGALQGLVGGALGLAVGVGIAALALRYFGGDLGGGYFPEATLDLPGLLLAAPAAVLFFALGLAAALIGSYLPARAAAREAPAQALKSSGGDARRALPQPWVALLLIAAGVACALGPPLAGLPVLGYVAMACLLFGGIAAMPWVARRLLAPFATSRRAWSVPVDLALKRLWAAPTAASIALCGIVASASLMVAMTVMIGSFRTSVDAWLADLLSADLYMRTNAVGGAGLTPADADRLAAIDGVARIDMQKVVPLSLSPSRPAVSLIARSVDETDPRRSVPLVRDAGVKAEPGVVPVWVSEAVSDLYGATPGQAIDLPLGDHATGRSDAPRFVVAGIWRDYARQFGSVVIRRDDYTRLTGDDRFPDAAIKLAAGATRDAVIERLRAALPDALQERAEFAAPSAIRDLSLSIFDRSFAVTYLLQAVAIVIGLAGVAATFSAQTLARSKEFGMLRHVGVTRRQVLQEVGAEGALLGVLGALSGGALGLAMSQVLIHVINPQSFHWTMDTHIPWITLVAVGLTLIVASAGTAIVSGRRAMSQAAIFAVREDW